MGFAHPFEITVNIIFVDKGLIGRSSVGNALKGVHPHLVPNSQTIKRHHPVWGVEWMILCRGYLMTCICDEFINLSISLFVEEPNQGDSRGSILMEVDHDRPLIELPPSVGFGYDGLVLEFA